MAFEVPITVAKALRQIERKELVLPAIQREFVWSREKICTLFDSLMRDYPMGSFLFWRIQKDNVGVFYYYDFLTDYHEQRPHNEPANLLGDQPVTAILDGQQRLTSLNIGLRGSHTIKLPRLRRDNPAAFPKAELYLDLRHLTEEPEQQQRVYDFRFLNAADVVAAPDTQHWFKVKDVLGMEDPTQAHQYLVSAGGNLVGHPSAFKTLWTLREMVHTSQIINFYLEESQSISKVLEVFIRINSGGTVLSHSDLLLSLASSQWTDKDAREEVNALVDQMNSVGEGFNFQKDRVLKASLVLSDFTDIKFKVENFKRTNMLTIEKRWDGISRALLFAVQLVSAFGFDARTLSAQNVIIPVAFYAMHRDLDNDYLTAAKYKDDRAKVQSFVVRSLLKAGFWTGAVDSILNDSRALIQTEGHLGFPLDEIEKRIQSSTSKSLAFTDEEIDDLVETSYGSPRAFLVLSLIYQFLDPAHVVHLDHIFPQKLFKKRELQALGIPADHVTEYQQRRDLLPNLQLVTGPQNIEKAALPPAQWLQKYFDEPGRKHYVAIHDLDPLPDVGVDGFLVFYEQRRSVLKEKLKEIVGPGA